MHYVYTIFFFQAEDGIRDRNVTGVQTCALPISGVPGVQGDLRGLPRAERRRGRLRRIRQGRIGPGRLPRLLRRAPLSPRRAHGLSGARRLPHIGPVGGSSPVGGTVDPAVNTTPSLFSASDPQRPSEAAARSLPVAYPERAAWGTVSKLRAWQAEALELYRDRAPKHLLAVATTGAGKPTFALQIAAGLLAEGTVRRITVVAPTEHLKTQWADAAARVGISLDPNFSNAQGTHGAHYQGVAVTYAQIGMHPALHRARTE